MFSPDTVDGLFTDIDAEASALRMAFFPDLDEALGHDFEANFARPLGARAHCNI